MRLNMANAFFVRYRGREALQRGLKRYEYLFAIMSAFEQWRAVKRCCVVEVKVQFLVLRQSAERARDLNLNFYVVCTCNKTNNNKTLLVHVYNVGIPSQAASLTI